MNIENQKIVEHRKHSRFSILEYALLQLDKKPISVRTLIVDISMGGAQLRSRTECKVGDKAYLIVGTFKDVPLKIPVTVRYCNTIDTGLLYAVGLKFSPKTKLQKAQVTNFVHNLFVTQGELLLDNSTDIKDELN